MYNSGSRNKPESDSLKMAIQCFRERKGYATMGSLKESGVHTRTLIKLLDAGLIVRIKPGLYRLKELSDNDYVSYVDVCMAVRTGVICLLSSADYYGLSTFTPKRVHVAIPHGYKRQAVEFPPTKFFMFRERSYSLGIETVDTEIGSFKIYNREKTVCDLFRMRKSMGEDIAIESLKNYLVSTNNNVVSLIKYAETLHVQKLLLPLIKGMVNA